MNIRAVQWYIEWIAGPGAKFQRLVRDTVINTILYILHLQAIVKDR